MACSKKLDKIDKIVISFTLIIVTFVCIFNTFCKANTPNYNTGLGYDAVQNIIQKNSASIYFYYYLQKNVEYTVKNNSTGNIGLAYIPGAPEINMVGDYIKILNPGSEYKFTPDENTYLYLYGWSSSLKNFDDIEIISSRNLSGVISDLVNFVGLQNIWSIFDKSIPYISIVILFALGVWFIKHNIIEHSKGREY